MVSANSSAQPSPLLWLGLSRGVDTAVGDDDGGDDDCNEDDDEEEEKEQDKGEQDCADELVGAALPSSLARIEQ